MRVFNLSLDDFSWHPKAGLNFESIYWCNELIKKYPEIKIDLFMCANYARLGESSYPLSGNIGWVNKVKQLPKNYSINLHGYSHRLISAKYGNSNNNECKHLSEIQASVMINNTMKEFEKVGLKYKKVFRPSGWHISKGTVSALINKGFIIAGNDFYYNIMKSHFSSLPWINYNWDLNNMCNIEGGDVIAYGHTSSWTSNYFCEKTYNYVIKLLENNEFDFRFLEELYRQK